MKLALRGSIPNIPWTAMNTPAPRPGIQRLVLGPCTGTPESPEPSLQAAPYISSTPLLQNSITVCEYGKSFTCILFIHLFIRHIHSLMDMCMYNILICMYIYICVCVCIHCVCARLEETRSWSPMPMARSWGEMVRNVEVFQHHIAITTAPTQFHHHHHQQQQQQQQPSSSSSSSSSSSKENCWLSYWGACVCVRACVSCPPC